MFGEAYFYPWVVEMGSSPKKSILYKQFTIFPTLFVQPWGYERQHVGMFTGFLLDLGPYGIVIISFKFLKQIRLSKLSDLF